jgi:phage-related tail protein
MALVGERGPELVNLPRGAQVIPNHKIAGQSGPVINISVPGNTSRETAQQVAMKVTQALALAGRAS